MKWFLLLVAAVVVFYGLHRLALWMEARGWLFYLNREPSSSTLGNAFLQIQSMVEPEKTVLLETRREEKAEDTESGDPPKTGGPS